MSYRRPRSAAGTGRRKRATAEGQYADSRENSGYQVGSCKKVTLKLPDLPCGTAKEQVEKYFEKQGDNAKVLCVELQHPGNAKVVLSGLTVEEVEKLEQKQHMISKYKIWKRNFSVEVVDITTLPPLAIKIDPLIAESLKKDPKELESCVQNLHVLITIDANTGTIQVVSTKRTIANWQKECKKCLRKHISSKYTRKERKIPKQAGFDIKNSLPKEAPIAISFNRDGTLLTTAGERDTMGVFYHVVEEICSEHEQTIEKQSLTPEEYCYFTVMKQAQVTAAHPEVKIKMNPENCTITLQGSVEKVKHLKQLLPKYVAHTSVLVQLKDPLVVQYLSTKDGKHHLSKFLQVKKCQVAVHFKQAALSQPPLHFLCDDSQADSARRCAKSLWRHTSINSFLLAEPFVSLLQEQDYDDLCRNLEKQLRIQVVTIQKQISVAGFEPDVAKCTHTLKEFIQKECMATTKMIAIEIDKGKWRLFCGAMNRAWMSILGQIQRENVKVFAPTDENATKPQVVLKGDRMQVEKASRSITGFLTSVVSSSIRLSYPGTCKFFRENEVLIRGIEATEKVVIEIKEIDDTMPVINVTADTTSPSQPIKVCVACTAEAKKILLYVGDITEFTRADVLVNAANGQLNHRGGVAKAIADKGGPVIQRESTQYIRRRGPLDGGDTWLTTKVGNLPYKALIHAVGPCWRGGSNKEQALLHKACYGSLQKAQNYNSIAIPAIGAGVYAFPIDRCADALIGAAVEFSTNNPGTPIQEIYFMLYDQKNVDTFVAALRKHITPQNVFVTKQHISPPVTHSMISMKHNYKAFQKEVLASSISDDTTAGNTFATPTMSSGAPPEMTSFGVQWFSLGHIMVQIIHGDITEQISDAVVNSTNSNLHLNNRGVTVSSALLKKGGPELQKECDKITSRGVRLQEGRVIQTQATGMLKCKSVFHTMFKSRDPKIFMNIIHTCLQKAEDLQYQSIAFPAIGTGAGRYPSQDAAKGMLQAIQKFASSKHVHLATIHIVLFQQSIYQTFLSTFQKKLPAPIRLSDDTIAGKTFAIPRMSSGASPQMPPFGVQWFPFGHIMVQIYHGDITNESSDAVVNSTNSDLRLKGGAVSSALLKKGGPELQAECDKITFRGGRLDEGNVMQTSATGTLKCKSVFHTKFESRDPKIFLKTVHTCLQKAEDLQYQSIAFPAIGTGAHGYPPEDAAKGTLQAIQKFASSKHVHLATIHIVLFQQSIHQTFLSTFQETISASQPHFVQWEKDWLGSLWQASCPDDSEQRTVEKPVQDEIMYRELEVRIYGEKETHVQKAEKMLKKIIEDQFVTEKVVDPNITNLTPEQKHELEKRGRELQVECEVNPHPLNYIRLRGDKGDVAQMKCQILQTLAQLEKNAGKTREAEHLHKVVQWKRQDSQGTWSEYDSIVNLEIEQAFNNPQIPAYEYQDHKKSEWFSIDFKKMEETDRITHGTYKVKRFDLEQQYKEGGVKPSHWVPMPVDPATKKEVHVHIVVLDPGCSEYKDVLKEFHRIMTPAQHYWNISKIERIQNPVLYGQYIARKKEMDKQNPQGHQNERKLFHGTSVDTVSKVNQQGFNRSFSGKNATTHGRGVYFARDASYSAQDIYSRPDSSGHKHMYIARVLTGEFTRGFKSMVVPPAKDPQKDPNLLFDSVVDNPANPGIFVIFPDSHVYPEYLITFN